MIRSAYKYTWARRRDTNDQIWELYYNVGFGSLIIVAYIQLFPKGQTAYWFEEGQKAIEGPNKGSRACDMSASLSACMDVVEEKLKK